MKDDMANKFIQQYISYVYTNIFIYNNLLQIKKCNII